MEYDKGQMISNIENELRSALSTYKFQPCNDNTFSKLKDDAAQIVRKYLIYNKSNYVLTNNDIIAESDEYDHSKVNIIFSDELLDALRNLDKNNIR